MLFTTLHSIFRMKGEMNEIAEQDKYVILYFFTIISLVLESKKESPINRTLCNDKLLLIGVNMIMQNLLCLTFL